MRQSSFDTLFNWIARWVDKVIQELQNEVVSRIGNWEVFRKYLKETLIVTILWSSLQLEKISKRLELYF